MLSYSQDLEKSLEFISKIPQGVSIFGSARVTSENIYYQEAQKLAGVLAKNSITVITGASGGIMEAANKGAFENGGISAGLNVNLPVEQDINQYLTHVHTCQELFVRKLGLLKLAKTFVIFPGGYGTLDELTEVLMYKITSNQLNIPVLLYNQKYWKPLVELIENKFIKEGMLSEEESRYFQIVNSVDEIAEIILPIFK